MRWSILIVFCACALSFCVGFFLGGSSWSWIDGGHSSEVAFWAMVGGWVSGTATLAAVLVSLWMAYQASQSTVEKILLTVSVIKKQFTHRGPLSFHIHVKNMKPIDTPLMKLLIQIDDAVDDLAPVRMDGIPLPYTLHQLGEQWKYGMELTPSIGWASIFENLSRGKPLKFKTGFFILETAMRKHRVKIPKEIFQKLIELHSKEEDFKKRQNNI